MDPQGGIGDGILRGEREQLGREQGSVVVVEHSVEHEDPLMQQLLPHARILMHRGSAGIGGSAVDIEVQADDLRHTVDTVLGLIAEDTGQPVERVFDDSLHDHWYTAAEARDYGFIDEIIGSFGQVMPSRKHRIGLKGAS